MRLVSVVLHPPPRTTYRCHAVRLACIRSCCTANTHPISMSLYIRAVSYNGSASLSRPVCIGRVLQNNVTPTPRATDLLRLAWQAGKQLTSRK